MKIPLIHVDRVLHVGTMEPARLGANGASQEGHCLSVSPCPRAWRRIARRGGNALHALARPNAAFLDLHAAVEDPETLAAIREWAVGEGLARQVTLWRAHREDDELEAWAYTLHATTEEALEEIGMEGEDPSDVPGPEGRPGVEPVTTYVGTQALAGLTGIVTGPERDATDAMVLAWTASVAAPLVDGGIDGVWWRADYAPERYEAPKAGIFPERVAGWSRREVAWESVDDESEMSRVPETVFMDVPPPPAP